MDHQDGISPQPNSENPLHSGPGRVGAVEGQADEDDFDDLVASGAFEDVEESAQEQVEEGQRIDGPTGQDGGEGQDPRERRAPVKPSPEEVANHNLTHIPRRMWCKICP